MRNIDVIYIFILLVYIISSFYLYQVSSTLANYCLVYLLRVVPIPVRYHFSYFRCSVFCHSIFIYGSICLLIRASTYLFIYFTFLTFYPSSTYLRTLRVLPFDPFVSLYFRCNVFSIFISCTRVVFAKTIYSHVP